jgi:hypothetical protein
MPFFKGSSPSQEDIETHKPIRRFKSLSSAINTIQDAYEKRFSKSSKKRSNSLETDTKSEGSGSDKIEAINGDLLEDFEVTESEVEFKLTMNTKTIENGSIHIKNVHPTSVLKKTPTIELSNPNPPPSTPKRTKKAPVEKKIDAKQLTNNVEIQPKKERDRSASIVWADILTQDMDPEMDDFSEDELLDPDDSDSEEKNSAPAPIHDKTKRYSNPRKDSVAPSLRSCMKTPDP